MAASLESQFIALALLLEESVALQYITISMQFYRQRSKCKAKDPWRLNMNKVCLGLCLCVGVCLSVSVCVCVGHLSVDDGRLLAAVGGGWL